MELTNEQYVAIKTLIIPIIKNHKVEIDNNEMSPVIIDCMKTGTAMLLKGVVKLFADSGVELPNITDIVHNL